LKKKKSDQGETPVPGKRKKRSDEDLRNILEDLSEEQKVKLRKMLDATNARPGKKRRTA
jgi:hypothetical protein